MSHVHETPRPGFALRAWTTAPLRRVQKCEVFYERVFATALGTRGIQPRNARLDNTLCGLFGGRGRNSIRGGSNQSGQGGGTGLTPVVAATIVRVSDDDDDA